MSFLRRLRGESTIRADRIDPAIDECMGDTAAYDWLDRLSDGDWREFPAFLDAQPSHQHRDFYIKVLSVSLAGAMSGWLDEWLELEPERSLAHLVAGQHAIASAWAVRTPYEAKHVSAERFAGFFDLLEVARSSLSEAARLDPDDGGPWAFMLSIAMGLEYERERIHEMYERVQSLDPWHPAAHGTMVQVLGAKWGGSTSAMLDFAHEVSNEAPEGELVHFVVPGAHFEASEFKGGEGYFRDPGVRRAIFDAAARSVDSSRLTASPWTVRVRNVFAVAYYQMGETDRLRRELEIIGPTITQPWTAFGNPVGEFKRARKMAGLR